MTRETDKARTVRLTPVYGFGWFDSRTNALLEVPAPFDLVVIDYKETGSGTCLVGSVGSDQHEFSNCVLVLSLRTVEQDSKSWNVYVFETSQAALQKFAGGDAPRLCTGFALTTGF